MRGLAWKQEDLREKLKRVWQRVQRESAPAIAPVLKRIHIASNSGALLHSNDDQKMTLICGIPWRSVQIKFRKRDCCPSFWCRQGILTCYDWEQKWKIIFIWCSQWSSPFFILIGLPTKLRKFYSSNDAISFSIKLQTVFGFFSKLLCIFLVAWTEHVWKFFISLCPATVILSHDKFCFYTTPIHHRCYITLSERLATHGLWLAKIT